MVFDEEVQGRYSAQRCMNINEMIMYHPFHLAEPHITGMDLVSLAGDDGIKKNRGLKINVQYTYIINTPTIPYLQLMPQVFGRKRLLHLGHPCTFQS